MCISKDPITAAYQTYRQELVDAGLLIPLGSPGVYGLSGVFERVVEQFIPVDVDKIMYRATVYDPVVYTRPWTIQIPLNRKPDELLEVACHEDNVDLPHLKDVRDEYRAQQKKGK